MRCLNLPIISQQRGDTKLNLVTDTDEVAKEVIQVQDDVAPVPECRRRVGRETRHDLEKENSKLNLHERSSQEPTNLRMFLPMTSEREAGTRKGRLRTRVL